MTTDTEDQLEDSAKERCSVLEDFPSNLGVRTLTSRRSEQKSWMVWMMTGRLRTFFAMLESIVMSRMSSSSEFPDSSDL